MKSSCGAQPHLPSFSHCDAHRTRRRCASNVICSSSHLRSSETQLPEDLYTVDVLYSSNSCAKRKLLLSPLTLLAWGLLPMEDADAISLKGAACPGGFHFREHTCHCCGKAFFLQFRTIEHSAKHRNTLHSCARI